MYQHIYSDIFLTASVSTLNRKNDFVRHSLLRDNKYLGEEVDGPGVVHSRSEYQ